MHLRLASHDGDPNIGLYCLATDKFVIAPDERVDNLSMLSENIIYTKVSETDFLGIFMCANSNGVLVPSIMSDMRLLKLEKDLKKIDENIKVVRIESNYTALGNLILCNDKHALVSPLLSDHKKEIESALGVKVKVSELQGMDIVGAICAATNKGFLMNINAEKEDYEFIEMFFGIEGDIGSVNFGSPFIKSGIVVNSRAVLVGDQTSGPEITRVDEAFGFININR